MTILVFRMPKNKLYKGFGKEKKLKKRIIAAIAALSTIAAAAVNAQALTLRYDGKTVEYRGSIYKLFVNNKELTNLPLEPIIFNDRALVPVREIFEELGAEVSYNGSTQCVEVTYDDTYVRMYINNNTAYINGKRTAVPDNVVPKLITKLGGETKTMVPVRFISESIGLDVKFDPLSNGIYVESEDALNNASLTPEPTEEPTFEPTEKPTLEPTKKPLLESTEEPTSEPVDEPAEESTPEPTERPAEATEKPKETVQPTKKPLSERPTGNDNGITGANKDMEYVMQGVDVSHWQNKINWEKAKDYVDFAILSMGYGQDLKSQDDAQFKRNASECEKYGIPYGVYIYSYATNPEKAAGEADHVLRMIKDCNLSFPVYYDLEDKSQSELTSEELGAIAKAFCDKIQAAGYEVGIYANTSWWTTKLTDDVFDNPEWAKWVAQYNSKCTYTGKYTMWQYTDGGSVSGMEGKIDMNYWYGTIRK